MSSGSHKAKPKSSSKPGPQRPKQGSTGPSTSAGKQRPTPTRAAARSRRRSAGMPPGAKVTGFIALIALVLLAGIFLISHGRSTSKGGAGRYAFQVGDPGPGAQAPAVQLPSSSGGTFDLAAARGKTVLLYFQEGLGCQPCWDQLKDIERQQSQFQALGIDQVASITGDPLNAIKQKVADEHITTPVLSDPDLRVSQTYNANQYGMMGTSRDGHTFIVVGPDGHIRWRADYGGSPNYTMFVPSQNLLADLRKGLGQPQPT